MTPDHIEPAIVVPAYSRPKALRRLLASLERAETGNAAVIVSLDGGCQPEVEGVAERFVARNGSWSLIRREKNMGLKAHILWCGDLSSEHGSVIVLEEDLFVDPQFYRYACAALAFYRDDDVVAGVSLYSHRYNEYAALPFEPYEDGYSSYYMMVPCSWGQCWTKAQWERFRDWYHTARPDSVVSCVGLPDAVKSWPESSWKKYFASYLVSTRRYFVYPYRGYVTNCSDAGGMHHHYGTHKHQVPLQRANRREDQFRFAALRETATIYDAFMEPDADRMAAVLNVPSGDLEVDHYGVKPLDLLKRKRLVLTSRSMASPGKVIPLWLRPVESSLLEVESVDTAPASLYLGSPERVKSERQPYLRLAEYYSYVPLHSKRFIKGYLPHVADLVWRTLTRQKAN